MKKILIIVITISSFFGFLIKANSSEVNKVTLYKCVDGDTAWFKLNNEIIKARFLAINTKESTNKHEKYGKEASEYTCNKLINSNSIKIEYDENSNKFDKYNRHLVWVFVNGKLLQSELVKEGLAEIKYIYGDYKYLNTLKNDEEYAKKNKLNIYSEQEYFNMLNLKIKKENFYIGLFGLFIIVIYIINPKTRKIINKYLIKILLNKKKSI